MPPADSAPTDLLRIDDELTDEERLVRDTVRAFAADRIMPDIADWLDRRWSGLLGLKATRT